MFRRIRGNRQTGSRPQRCRLCWLQVPQRLHQFELQRSGPRYRSNAECSVTSAELLGSVTPAGTAVAPDSDVATARSVRPFSPERGSGARATAAAAPVALIAVVTLGVLLLAASEEGTDAASAALPCGGSAAVSALADSTVAVGRFGSCSGDIGERPPYGFVPCYREFGLGYSTRWGLEQRRG